MWPMYVDYSDEECKKVLRSLELEAYSSIVSAFRAQGSLTKDRKKMLQDLCSALSISVERHRAEIRRAVNDEHLNTIAERLFGPNTATEWAIEGRRVVPLVNRLAPQTVFSEIASNVATAQAIKNSSLPLPGKTGKEFNGMETMASRKRKECPPDSTVSPQKMAALDSQYFHNLHSLESSSSVVSEPMQVPEVSMSSESFSVPESSPQTSSSFSDFNAQKNVPPLVTHPMPIASSAKSPSKHSSTKSPSTITTFSTSDQMTSNLLASRSVIQTCAPSVAHEEQMSVITEIAKLTSDGKCAQRPLSSISSMKSSTIVIPTTVPSTCSTSSSKDRLSTSSSSTSHNKFLSQIKSKPSGHTRQNLPAGLGIKLTSQPSISQRASVSPKSPGMKVKQDNANIFSKKTSTVFPSSTTDNQPSQLPTTTSSESLTVTKSAVSATKPSSKSDSQTAINQQSTSKQTATAKNLPKTTSATTTTSTTTTTPTTSHGSQYVSRPLFPASAKSGAKNLSPVIFNVSTSCAPLQNTVKQTGQIQSEGVKSSPQLLPKTTPVGLSSSHLKLNPSTTQTIQYRNDGGLVRSARIVNLSQPVGSRLPCAISSSAISALGLSSSIASTALRVTLPAGTLNTTNSIRVSSAAKPNVIVVHKAQMWPRPPQGAAVIMSSAPLTKLANDIVQETISINPKPDKSKSSGIKTIPRAIAPARPQSPAVAITSIKASESPPASNSHTITTSQPDSSTPEARNSKPPEKANDGQCRKNLLAEVIEVSGILENPAVKSSKEKSEAVKNNKEVVNLSNHQELEKEKSVPPKSTGISSETNTSRLTESNTSKTDTNSRLTESNTSKTDTNSRLTESNTSKTDTSSRLTESNTSKTDANSNKAATAEDFALTVSQSDINGKETPKQVSLPTEVQPKEAGSIAISSTSSINETVTSSSECGSKPQKETDL